jgi:hypothetical protein
MNGLFISHLPEYKAIEANKQLFQEQASKDYDRELVLLTRIENASIIYKNPEQQIKKIMKELNKIRTNRLWLYAKISECKKAIHDLTS